MAGALTRAAAQEFAPHGIIVNAYCPGVVDTDMWVAVDREMAQHTGAAPGATYAKSVAVDNTWCWPLPPP